MAKETENILGNKITDGHVITKYGHKTNLQYLTLTEAGHPIPDTEGVKGMQKIFDIISQTDENDLIIWLISGGASALMADFPEGTTLDDLKLTNELDVIASGPMVSDPTTFADALAVVEKYSLKDFLPAPMLRYLLKGVNGSIPETPKPGNPIFQNVFNYIIGSNRIALESAAWI